MLGRSIGLILCIVFITNDAYASQLEANIPQCSIWLKDADKFAETCKDRSRDFERTFNPGVSGKGVREQHFVWFDTIDPYKHFTLGCVLKSDRSILFVGIYYTAKPGAISSSNVDPLRSISFNGDVTIKHNGADVTFVPVQPFDTLSIQTIWHSEMSISKNCDDPAGDGYVHLSSSSGFFDLSHYDRDQVVDEGAFSTTSAPSKYIEIFPSKLPRQVIYSWYNVILVLSNGALLVKSSWYDRACASNEGRARETAQLLTEICIDQH